MIPGSTLNCRIVVQIALNCNHSVYRHVEMLADYHLICKLMQGKHVHPKTNPENPKAEDEITMTIEDVKAVNNTVRDLDVRGVGDSVPACDDVETSTSASGSHVTNLIPGEQTEVSEPANTCWIQNCLDPLMDRKSCNHLSSYFDSRDEREASWYEAIRSENVDEVEKCVKNMTPWQLVMVETVEGQMRGRTALHIAAKNNDAELAKLILDKLLVFRQEVYTAHMDEIFCFSEKLLNKDKDFRTIGEYIRAVEKSSRKTAFELAKEQNRSEKGEIICEKIVDTLNRSEAHVGIDEAVDLEKQLVENVMRNFFKFSPETLAAVDESNPSLMGKTSIWLSKVISIRDCNFLKEFLDLIELLENSGGASVYREKYIQLWKFKDDSGRTLLHVVVMQGCFLLAKQLLDIARKRKDPDYIEAIDPESGLTALKMANDILGNKSIAEYIKKSLKVLEDESYVHPSFSEAYPQTRWCRALKGEYGRLGSSEILSDLLTLNHQLLLHTWNGITVLHAALLFKSRSLLRRILHIFGKRKMVYFGELYYPSELTLEEMSQQKACVHEHYIFDEKIDEYSKETWTGEFRAIIKNSPALQLSSIELLQYFWSEDGTVAENEENMETLSWKLSKTVMWLSKNFSNSIKDLINEKWIEEWEMGYCADVDFNFERKPRQTLLKVHYACKHPIKFKEFLQSMLSFEKFLIYYGSLHDGQGRTMFHILVDHSNTQVRFPGRWILDEILEDRRELYKLAQDARGRTLNDILLMKNYLQHNIFLQNTGVLQYDFDFMKSGIDTSLTHDSDSLRPNDNYYDYIMFFMLYLVATILKQTSVAQRIWSRILEKDSKRLREMLCAFEPLPFIASSTGNQVLLRLLMEEAFDLTIHDASGRTLLHHAADSTLLEFADLLKCPMIGHCFSTVMDFCEAQKKWNLERKKTAMILPSSESEKQFDVENNTSRLVSRESEKQSDVEKLVTSMNVERKACILLLLQAGVDLSQEDKFKKTPNIGPNKDTTFQSWWYDLVVKDSTDKKNNFNQAASALSVVATLVAATSYIGPLQPPMNYTDGLVNTSVKLVRMFMVTNTLAFYFAMTSVILAVVPSLPMPRESVLSELKRAQHIVSVSLYLLLMSIICIILSFGAASMVVMHDQYSFPGSDLLFFPTILGCLLCFIAIVSFLIRVMKLTFYESPTIRCIYQFSFTKFCKGVFQWCTARLSPAETASPKPASKNLLCKNCFAEASSEEASVAKTPLQKPALKKSPSSG
ncbi:hypothetical protein KC19_12G102000 [Ceratodon purpureus]|uniref:PGG domain-containing protein n=1 Tax=Ceratodon purpureus TaxID=3225 RepID=A0A8T0G9N2_CERPU|nr:hypothetical protein KC19_12G102000 [Ceratodon purpureus]